MDICNIVVYAALSLMGMAFIFIAISILSAIGQVVEDMEIERRRQGT